MDNKTFFLDQNDTIFSKENKTFFINQEEMFLLNQDVTSFANENETSYLNHQFLSSYVQEMFFMVNGCVLLVLAGTGCVTNVFNMKIFHKLGLDSSINVSFLSLSVADFACACIYLLVAVIMLDKCGLVNIGVDLTESLSFVGVVVVFLTTQGTWANALISAERWCCVVFPMKVKSIFTTKTTVVLIAGMLVVQIAAIITNLATFDLSIAGSTNSTRPQLRVAFDISLVMYVFFVAVCVPSLVCFSVIFAGTVYLGVALNQKSKWLQSTYGRRFPAVARNKRLAFTAFWISVIYIACFLPSVIIAIFSIAATPITTVSGQTEFDFMVASIPLNLQAISGATNFFVYLKMNPEYRRHLETMLCAPCSSTLSRHGRQEQTRAESAQIENLRSTSRL